MALLPGPELPASFPPYEEWKRRCGFVPAFLCAQTLLPRVIEAESQLTLAVLLAQGSLTAPQKSAIVRAIASLHGSAYCEALASGVFSAPEPPPAEHAGLVETMRRLGRTRGGLQAGDFDALRHAGFTDEALLEAIVTTALARFICTTAAALRVEPDGPVPAAGDVPGAGETDADPAWATAGPYVRAADADVSLPPFVVFQDAFGFVPNLFRAQTLRPEVLSAQASMVRSVLMAGDELSRRQKEAVLLVVSAGNLNTSCTALHSEMLRALGVDEETCDQMSVDHGQARLSPADVSLLDVALRAARGNHGADDLALLRSHGFSDAQVLEAAVTAALAVFLNTLQSGLGTPPDFTPRRILTAPLKPAAPAEHPEDPDAQLVGRARDGDVGAFEELVRRHHRRIYRAALAVTGNEADAEDAAQVAFVKAFNALGTFERHARFTTWVTRIAINEALSRVRAQRPADSLPLDGDEEGFRPSIAGAWAENPEQLYERGEMRRMIERALSEMPVKYRMAVLLRDVEQLSTIDAASALGLPVPTLKKHLLKGRLLLREALAPHFSQGRGAVAGV